MEYCSHFTVQLLDSMHKRGMKLNNPLLTDEQYSLDHRRRDGDLMLFYRYFNKKWFTEIASITPSEVEFRCKIRLGCKNSNIKNVAIASSSNQCSPSSFKYWRLANSVYKGAFQLTALFKKIDECYFCFKFHLKQ